MRRASKICLGLAIGAGSLYVLLRSLDAADVRRGLSEAQLSSLLLAALPLALSYYVRGVRWRHLFPDRVRQRGLRHVTGSLMIGFLLNNFLPARAGELTRALLMARHNGVPMAGTLATLFLERLFDGLVLGTAGVIALRVFAGVELGWLQHLTLAFVVLFVLVLAGAARHAMLARWVERTMLRFPGPLARALGRMSVSAIEYVGAFASARAVMLAIALTGVVWTFESISFALVARAVGVELDPSSVCGLLSVTNFALLVPIPGGVGVVEFAGTALLSAVGLSRETAFVAVAVQHLLQYALCLLWGGLYVGRLELALRDALVEPGAQLSGRGSLET